VALPTFDENWFQQDAAEKIRRFNAAGTTIDELQTITDAATINWMLANNYSPPAPAPYSDPYAYYDTGPTYNEPVSYYAPTHYAFDGTGFYSEYDKNVYETQVRAEQQRIADARAAAERAEQQRIADEKLAAEQQDARNKAASVGVNLPANWFSLSPQNKADWFVSQSVTEGQLLRAGVPESDIRYMQQNLGYYDVKAKQEADRQEAQRLANEEAERQRIAIAQQEAAQRDAIKARTEQGIGALFQNILGRNPNQYELRDLSEAFGAEVSQDEIDRFRYMYLDEIEENELTRRANELKAKIAFDNPDAKVLTDRVIIESINNNWSPQESLALINKAFGVNKTMADYERAMEEFFGNTVTNMLSNGATVNEIRQIAEEQGIRPDVAEIIINQTTNTLEDKKIRDDTKNLITIKTVDGKQVQELNVAGLIKWADSQKLSYTDVADAYKSIFPDLTTDMLVYERDRTIFNNLVDPDTKQINFSEAIKEAINRGIEKDNLAGFFGKTEAEFTDLVKNNLGAIASQLRQSGVNPEAGLGDLLGIEADATTNALKTYDLTQSLNLLAVKDSQGNSSIPMDRLIKFGQDYNVSDQEIANILNIKPADLVTARQQIADTKDRSAVSATLDQLGADGQLTYNELLGVIGDKQMSIEEFVNRYLAGDKAKTISELKKEAAFTPEQRNVRDAYISFNSQFTKDNPATYGDIAEFIGKQGLTDKQAVDALGTFGLSLEALSEYRTDKQMMDKLAEAQGDGTLSFNEILGVVDNSGLTINEFVTKYFGNNNEALAKELLTESKFTPQERAERDSYRDFLGGFTKEKPATLADITRFIDQKGISDAQAEKLFSGLTDVSENQLGSYRKDAFITSGLNALRENDNLLDLKEITAFANTNNIPLQDIVKYVAEPAKQEATLKALEETRTDLSWTPDENATIFKAGNRLVNPLEGVANFGTKQIPVQIGDQETIYQDVQQTAADYLASNPTFGNILAGRSTFVESYKNVDGNLVKVANEDITPQDVADGNAYFYIGGKTGGPNRERMAQMYQATGNQLKPVGEPKMYQGEAESIKDYAMPIAIIAAVAAPYLLPEIIGAAAPAVAGVEGVAAQAALSGTGLTGSMIAAGIPVSVAPYAATALVNGMYSGAVSEATGGDFEKGFFKGVAPVIGQLASNAVNLALSDISLPAGVDKAVGNAISQLISTGQIDPTQMFIAGVSPTISNAVQNATGLTAAQTNFVLNTVATQGANLTALLNPSNAINFVMANQQLFNELGTSAATGTTGITRADPVDLGAFNEGEVKTLTAPVGETKVVGTSPVGASTNVTLGQTGLEATSVLEANNIYNVGQNQFVSVSPGTMYTLSDLYGYGGTAPSDVRPYGDANVAEIMAGVKQPVATVGDAGVAELMANVRKPDAYQMDIVGADYGTPTAIDWKTTSIRKLTDETGKVYDIPRGAVLNYTAEGELTGYRVGGVDFRLDKPGGVFKPYTPAFTASTFNPENKTSEQLWADFQKVVPNATPQLFQAWSMAALAGEKSGVYVPMTAFNPTEQQRTTLLQDVANLAKGAGSGVVLGGSDLVLATLGWAQAAAREAGYDVKFQSIDDVLRFQKDVEARGNKDFQNIFRSTVMSLPSTLATAGVVMTGGGVPAAALVAGTSAGLVTAGRDYSEAYNQLIQKGYSPSKAHDQALFRAWATGGAEGLGESIFPGADVKLIRSIFNLSPSDVVKQYGITLAKELPPEIATAALQTYIDTLPGIGLQPNRTYTVDEMLQILRDTTVTTAGQIAVTGAGAKLVQQATSRPVVNQSGQQILNRDGSPVLMLTNQQKTTGFQLSFAPTSGPTIDVPEYVQSSPAESVFDAVLDNEGKYNYTLQSVNLDNNVFTIKTNDGDTVTFSADQILNNALNLRTQENPGLATDVQNSIDIADRLSVDLATSIQSLPSENITGTIVSANTRGAIMETNDGKYVFVPNYNSSNTKDGVATAPIQVGDKVIASQTVVSPMVQVTQPDGGKTITIDATRINPLAGLGTVIGLNDSQALVVTPTQQVATVDRANLSSTPEIGKSIPINQSIISSLNVPITTIQDDFGLTSAQVAQSLLTPSLTASQLPSLVTITNPAGATTLLDTSKPNVGIGNIVSVNPGANTALVSTATGSPQVVDIQGASVTVGSDIFFNPTTSTILGTPVTPQITTQTQPQVIQETYTPIGTPVITTPIVPGVTTPLTPSITTPSITTPSGITPSITTIDTVPGGVPVGVDTISVGVDTISTSVDTISTGTDTIPGGTTPGVTTPGGTTPATKPQSFPSLFFPFGAPTTRELKFDYPVVPPPELPPYTPFGPPNYLRPLEPYLGYGIGSLMGDLYDEKQGYGGNKPIENAQSPITIPT